MRLVGEASGAATALLILRAALACLILSREAGEGHRAQRGGEGACGAIFWRRRVAGRVRGKPRRLIADFAALIRATCCCQTGMATFAKPASPTNRPTSARSRRRRGSWVAKCEKTRRVLCLCRFQSRSFFFTKGSRITLRLQRAAMAMRSVPVENKSIATPTLVPSIHHSKRNYLHLAHCNCNTLFASRCR